MRILLALGLLASAAQAADYTPPPRNVDDILAVLEQYKPEPAEVEKRTRAATAEPPANADAATLARFYSERSHARSDLGSISGRIEDLRRSLEHSRKADQRDVGPQQGTIRNVLIELGNAEYLGGNYVNAVAAVKEAVDVAQGERLGSVLVTASTLAALYANMGDIAAAQERLAVAERSFSRLRSSANWTDFGDWWTAHLERARGYVLIAEGRYPAAETALRKSMQAFDAGRAANLRRFEARELGGIPPGNYLAQRNRAELALGNAMAAQGRLAEAETAVRNTLIKNLAFFGRYSVHVGSGLVSLARIVEEQGRFREASLLAAAAAESLTQAGAPEESYFIAGARSALGASLVAQAQWPEAIAAYEKRMQGLARDPLVLRQLGHGDINWAYALVKTGAAPRAETMLRDLLATQAKRLGDKDRSVAELRGYLAIALAAQGQRAQALEEFRRAVPQLLDAARADQAAETGGTARWMRTTNVLEAYLDLLAQMPRDAASGFDTVEEGFRIADAARGSSVQRALAESAARGAIRDPALAELARTEQDTQHRIAALSELLPRLLAAPPEQQLTKIVGDVRSDLDTLRAQHDGLRLNIQKRFPDYAALTAPRPLTMAAAQAALRPGEALISLYVAPTATYAWAVPQQGRPIFAAASIGRDALAKRVEHLREALDIADASLAKFPKFDLDASHALYAEILKPLEPALAGANSLLIVSHGALGHLPFAVLTTEPHVLKPDPAAAFETYKDAPWLIKRAAITQLPSVGTLATLRRAPKAPAGRREFIGFGDPMFTKTQVASAPTPSPNVTRSIRTRNLAIAKVQSKTDLQADANAETTTKPVPVAVANSSEIAQLAPLPDTSEEILRIAEVLHADAGQDIFLRLRANESVIKKLDLSRRRVIMFATHGLVPGDLNGLTQPALALSSPDVVGGTDDGLLTMEEILALKLDADWVVLSACNTASGEGAGAEAVSGLGRAFFYAGARALLVSNWPVETTSARQLTTGLFRQQAEKPGMSRAEALRQTMLAVMNGPGPENGSWGFTYGHPMFWAPFSLVGEGAAQ